MRKDDKRSFGGSMHDLSASERLSGLNLFDEKSVASEMGAALLPQQPRRPSVDITKEKLVRGQTTIDIDAGLSFEENEEESDEEMFVEPRRQASPSVELMGSQNRARSGNSLVSSRSRKLGDIDLKDLYDGPTNTDGNDVVSNLSIRKPSDMLSSRNKISDIPDSPTINFNLYVKGGDIA